MWLRFDKYAAKNTPKSVLGISSFFAFLQKKLRL